MIPSTEGLRLRREEGSPEGAGTSSRATDTTDKGLNVLDASGGVGFEGVTGSSCGAMVMTASWGGLNVEVSLGWASPFGSEGGSSNAPVAEPVDFVDMVESPPALNFATRSNVPAPVRRRSILQNQSTGFVPRSQNVTPSMGMATTSLEALKVIMRNHAALGRASQGCAPSKLLGAETLYDRCQH